MADFRDGARRIRRLRAESVLRTVTTNYATYIAGNIRRAAPVKTSHLSRNIFKDTDNPYTVRVFTLVPYAPYPQTVRRQFSRQGGRRGSRRGGRGFPPYWKLGQRWGTTRARQQNAPALREWLRSR